MSAKTRNKRLIEASIFLGVIIVLLLSLANVKSLSPKSVLGVEVESAPSTDTEYWQKFTEDNPNYIPGWIELGNLDKVKEIDPNYF